MNTLTQTCRHYPSSVGGILQSMLDGIDSSGNRVLIPAVDVTKDANNFMIKADMPGFRKSDISLELKDEVLTFWAERSVEPSSETRLVLKSERRAGTYKRIIELPYPVDTNKISASFENGVLEITCPLKDEAKARAIPIL